MQSNDGWRHGLPQLLENGNNLISCFQLIEEGGHNKGRGAAIVHCAVLLQHAHAKPREASSGGTARMLSDISATDMWSCSLQLTVLNRFGFPAPVR